MKTYRIRSGGSFRAADGSLKTAGDTIELPSDVAATHAGVLDELTPEQLEAEKRAAEERAAATAADGPVQNFKEQ